MLETHTEEGFRLHVSRGKQRVVADTEALGEEEAQQRVRVLSTRIRFFRVEQGEGEYRGVAETGKGKRNR